MNIRTLCGLLTLFITCTGYGQAVKKAQTVNKTLVAASTKQTAKLGVPISSSDAMYLANSLLTNSNTVLEPFSPGQGKKTNALNVAQEAAKVIQNSNSQVAGSSPKSPTLADQLMTKGPQKYGIVYLPSPVYNAWKSTLDDLIYMVFFQEVAVNVDSDAEMEQKIAAIRSTIINDMFNAEHSPNYQSSIYTSLLGYNPLRSFQGSQAPFRVFYMDPRLIYEASLANVLDKWMKDGVLTKEGALNVVGLKYGAITVN